MSDAAKVARAPVGERGGRGQMGVAVDLAIFTVQERRLDLLLIQMRRAPFTGKWALPGGRTRGDETVEEAAARELREKTGLDARTHARGASTAVDELYLEQLYTFSDPARDPDARCISVAHLALIRPTTRLRTTDKYSGIGWFPVTRLPELAFDHAVISFEAVERLRAKIEYTDLARNLLPPTFTLGELQRLYEAIWGRPLDARNFQRRVQVTGLVKDTGRMRRGEAHRPARLFKFG